MKRAWRGKSERRLQARDLRENLTPSEQILWSHLRACALGVKFRQQHPIGGFIADFYAASLALIVEVDGPIHAQTSERDAQRDLSLRSRGVRVLRFSADDVVRRTALVLQQISKMIDELRREPPPPPASPLFTPKVGVGAPSAPCSFITSLRVWMRWKRFSDHLGRCKSARIRIESRNRSSATPISAMLVASVGSSTSSQV